MKRLSILFILLVSISIIVTSCSTINKNTSLNSTDNPKDDTNTSFTEHSRTLNSSNSSLTEENILSTSELSYYCKNINEMGETELIRSFEYTFPNGEKTFTTYDNPKIFVMVNGAFEPSIEVIKENNNFFISNNLFEKFTNSSVEINNEKISIACNNKNFELEIGQTTFHTDKKTLELDTSPIVFNDTVYIPLDFITDVLNLTASNLGKEYQIMWNNRVIAIDENLPESDFTKEEALNYLKESLHESYKVFENYLVNYEHNESFKNSVLKSLKTGIDEIEFSFTFSKYYVFSGGVQYQIYVDIYNKNIYFQYDTIRMAEISKIDLTDPEIFKIGYLID